MCKSSPYGIVYSVTNRQNGMKYVGQTTQSMSDRWRRHRNGGRECRLLWNAICKYGHESFSIEVLASAYDRDELDAKEVEFIALLETRDRARGYNLASGGHGALHAPESKLKISESLRGRPLTSECKRKISEAKLGKKQTPEQIAKMMHAKSINKGFKHTAAAKLKMSQSALGKKMPPATAEHRARLSVAAKAAWAARKAREEARV